MNIKAALFKRPSKFKANYSKQIIRFLSSLKILIPGSPCLGPASFQLDCGYPVREGNSGSAVNEVPDRA